MNTSTEPVRLSGYVALAVGLGLLAVIGWAMDVHLKALAGQLAAVAITSIGGLEFARAHVTPTGRRAVQDTLDLLDDR